MTTPHDTRVDGVRCFWVETGRPTLAARLLFRQGIADEPITESGWQHLIEHTALDRFGRGGPVDINGHVSLHETAFDFHGEPAAVAEHLTRLTRWLADPTFDRLDHEIGVLRAEADVRGGSALGRALSWRYGASGPGLAAYSEPGLGRATAESLVERVGRVFTRGNGILILDGPPAANLSLPLHSGDLLPLPAAVPVETPNAAYEDGAGIVVSGTVAREGDMFVGADVLHRVLVERLRHDEGAAYAPWTNYERVDADTAVVTAGSDIRPELTSTIVGTMIDLLDQLAVRGPRQDWLDETVETISRGMRDPYAVIGAAMGAGMRVLHGREPESLEEMIERVRSTTVDRLAVGFGELRDSLLLGAPEAALADRRLRLLRFPTTPPSDTGTAYRSINCRPTPAGCASRIVPWSSPATPGRARSGWTTWSAGSSTPTACGRRCAATAMPSRSIRGGGTTARRRSPSSTAGSRRTYTCRILRSRTAKRPNAPTSYFVGGQQYDARCSLARRASSS